MLGLYVLLAFSWWRVYRFVFLESPSWCLFFNRIPFTYQKKKKRSGPVSTKVQLILEPEPNLINESQPNLTSKPMCSIHVQPNVNFLNSGLKLGSGSGCLDNTRVWQALLSDSGWTGSTNYIDFILFF